MHRKRLFLSIGAAGALVLAGGAGVTLAEGQGGAAADSAGSFEVTGVTVDVKGRDAESARLGGWRIAQRKGWQMLSQRLTGEKSDLSDSAIDALVSGVVIEQEQIGPTRYIARLGIQFDRARAGAILGVSTQMTRSVPTLLVPLEFSGGTGRVFERETAWARAWNRFRATSSTIDYDRLRGNGADSLLVNAGQTLRRGRNWWRTVLDQYGASDMVVAEVQLRRDYPGGPVVGLFAATHGPDRTPITHFALRVESADAIDSLYDTAIQRIDAAFQTALADGRLRPDRMLATRPPAPKPVVDPAAEAAAAAAAEGAAGTVATITVQVETPNAAAVNASESALRATPGVRSAVTSSLALGGISVVRVAFEGNIGALRSALEARGWQVQEGAGVLRIRRPGGGGSASSSGEARAPAASGSGGAGRAGGASPAPGASPPPIPRPSGTSRNP